MKHAFLALAALMLSPVLGAQATATVPTGVAVWSSNNFPLAAPPIRYQQWIAPSEFQALIGREVRVQSLTLFGGSPGGQTGAQINVEIIMGNGPEFQPTQLMDQNLTNPNAPFATQPVVVVPRSNHVLGTATAGGAVITFPFQNEFIWDGKSAVVVDIKMFDNGKGNLAYNYDFQYSPSAFFRQYRLWGLSSDPRTVQVASFFQPSQGVTMQFNYADGVSVSFGNGCAGAGNIVPVATTEGGLPIAPNPSWTHVVHSANSQTPAVLLLGVDDQNLGGLTLPLNMQLAGVPGNCMLYTNIIVPLSTTTVGGGFGAGTGKITVPVPPVPFTGQVMFSQWLLFDAQSPNGVISMTQAQKHIFG